MILLDPAARPVIAHRGNRAHAPENTLEAFRQAVAVGAEAIEFDLRLSRDGEVVVIHDPTLDRTTDSSGFVEMKTLEQLRQVDAGARFSLDGGWARPYFGRGISIPTFNELVDAMPSTLPMLIEIKTASVSEPLRRIIRDRDLGKRVVVAAFEKRSMQPFRSSGLALGATMSEAADLLLPALRGKTVTDVPFDALCISQRWKGVPLPLAAIARCIRRAGKVIHVWTVNDPAEAQQLWRNGVHGIITDDPALMIAARAGV